MQTWLQDVRYSLRQLIKNPGFTLTAVVSLALGIGATTAVFSVIYAALINPYPYPSADRIVRLTTTSKAGSSDWVNPNGPQIRQLRQLRVVESVLAMDFQSLILTAHDLPENVRAITLISNGFDDLGVPRCWDGDSCLRTQSTGRTRNRWWCCPTSFGRNSSFRIRTC